MFQELFFNIHEQFNNQNPTDSAYSWKTYVGNVYKTCCFVLC